MTPTSRKTSKRGGLVAAALLFLSVVAAGPAASAAPTTSDEATADPLVGLYDTVSRYSPADYTAASWASFSSSRDAVATLVQRGGRDSAERAAAGTKLQSAADGLVMVRGLKTLVADYKTRSVSGYTADSWAPLAAALNTAATVASNPSATAREVAVAKTALYAPVAVGNVLIARFA